jgi:hypothetical protein
MVISDRPGKVHVGSNGDINGQV